MTNLLEIKNLKLSFGKADPVLKGIDLSINSKEIVAVVGESGSGKSVTALSILQLINTKVANYSEGNIFIYNQTGKLDVLQESESSLQSIRGRQVSIVFQNPMSALNPSLKCGDQVAEMIALHHHNPKAEIKEQVLDLFRKVMLPDVDRIYRSYPHQLSGGQLQRVMISMAVANRPALIIADEPTTALDVTVQKEILTLLRSLQEENDCAILFISHDLGLVREIADRVIVMYQGKIVEDGLTDQIFERPQHRYTKGLIACRPPLDKKLYRLPVLGDFLDQEQEISSLKETVDLKAKESSPTKIIMEVNNLKKYFVKEKNFFGKATAFTKAVDNVSFVVHKGESLALVGESGSGKSTIGNCILSLIKKDEGSILFDGQDIEKMEAATMKKFRKRCQVIFQNPYASLNPRIKIGEAIREPIITHNIVSRQQSKQRVISLLERVGLEALHYDRYPHEFSGGQQQRINIARALSVNPEFIICDECVSALDVSVQAMILNLLKDLQEEYNLSYLFITHDFSVVRFLCDRAIVLKEGSIVEEGTVSKIIDQPSHHYTKQLIESII